MTRNVLITVLLLFFGHLVTAQNCHCADEFLFLKGDIEKNYAGFRDKTRYGSRDRTGNATSLDDKAAYDALSQDILKRARQATRPIYCLSLLKEWLAFFKDRHTSIGEDGSPAPSDSASLRKAIEETEVIPNVQQELTTITNRRGIEGIYFNADSTYKIAIIKSKTTFRDYAGVVLVSKSPSWQPGQVKLELKQTFADTFTGYAYFRDHSVQIRHFDFDGNSFNNGEWTREGAAIGKPDQKNAASAQYNGASAQYDAQPTLQAKRISDKTFYIRIGSFEVSNLAAIDSLFKKAEDILRSTPHLIIDVRGNGGGGDASYGAIIPWLYTGPIHLIGVDGLASEDNIQRWETLRDDKDMPSSVKEEIRTLVARLQTHVGQFVSTSDDTTITLGRRERYPEKIAILVDSNCASATEEFLLLARQSKKVTLMGQHSAGVLDYSNVLMVHLPCLPYIVGYATSRSRRLDRGKGIDNIGIQPDILLANDKNWIVEATRFLEK